MGKANFKNRLPAIPDLPLAILGLVYLGLYAAEVASRDALVRGVSELSQWVIWLVFLLDLLLKLLKSSSSGQFVRTNLLGIVAAVIPFFRALSIFRVLIALRGISGFLNSRSSRAGLYVGLAIPLAWFSGAVAVLDAELSASDGAILTLPDALWWSLTTITTIGYGDATPVTLEGRVVAAGLMVAGVALFSAGAGLFAAWLMEEKTEGTT